MTMTPQSKGTRAATWRPTATLEALRFRAEKLAIIRRYFAEHAVLEVETPIAAHGGSVDPQLDSLSVKALTPAGRETLWLQTSPEFHMKRLLAAGSGPIYQLFRAFRDGESGGRHNIEFTMLEWYQPGYDLGMLREECVELMERVLKRPIQLRVHRYRELFQQWLDIDPFTVETATLNALVAEHGDVDVTGFTRDDCLDLLFSHVIEPHLGELIDGPVVLMDAVIDYPASQAALAKKHLDPEDGVELASRFELYWQGVELANGYHELSDADEQLARFNADNQARQALGKDEIAHDNYLIEALREGLPSCSGVALGVDRLIMLAAGKTRLEEVIAFPTPRA